MDHREQRRRFEELIASTGYPGVGPKESIERYRLFLSAPLLREIVSDQKT
jgi:hypothetical protein